MLNDRAGAPFAFNQPRGFRPMCAPTSDAGVTSAPLLMLVRLDFPGASIRVADFRVRLLNFRKTVARRLGRIQSEQSGRNALGAGGGPRRRRHQRNEGYRSGKYEGLLEEFRHDDFSFG